MSVKIEIDWDDLAEDTIGYIIQREIAGAMSDDVRLRLRKAIAEQVQEAQTERAIAAAIAAHVDAEVKAVLARLRDAIDVKAIVRAAAEEDLRRRVDTVTSAEIRDAIVEALESRKTKA